MALSLQRDGAEVLGAAIVRRGRQRRARPYVTTQLRRLARGARGGRRSRT